MSSTGLTAALESSLPHATPAPESTVTAKKLNEGRTPLRFRHPEASNESDSSSDDDDGNASSDGGSTTAVDTASSEDNYVRKVIAKERPLPPITWKNLYKNINVVSTLALTVVPILTVYGAFTTELKMKTFIWAVVYYYITGLGITAGYHRLWAHRSYTASKPLQYFLALGGAGAVEGSISWWARGHRAHHRYTDTELDPYDAGNGFWWSHLGWMLVKPRRRPGTADVSDLKRNPVVQWQHRWYLYLIIGMGFVFPTVVAGYFWNDWRGGFYYAAAARLLFVHHSTFCVNSLAHWLGATPFDDKHTPRDHIITALVTIGEGYHNFHHEFPQDFRNAIKWFQYDPTKWFIWTMSKLHLASQLKSFPNNEIRKGQIAMEIKKLSQEASETKWPSSSDHLPVLTWDEFQEASETRKLVVIGGFIHDVEQFINDHPGGVHLIKARLGKDATTAFYGGVYDHSNGAGNLLAMLRVGCIEGGYEVESLKKYSDIIASLAESGASGVGGKGADLGDGKGQKMATTVIKGDPSNKSLPLPPIAYEANLNSMQLNGGI